MSDQGTPDRTLPKSAGVYLAQAAIAGGVLCWAVVVSTRSRNMVDWIVFTLVGAAILWNLARFALALRRPHSVG